MTPLQCVRMVILLLYDLRAVYLAISQRVTGELRAISTILREVYRSGGE